MPSEPGPPIRWKLLLASPPAHVFVMLSTERGLSHWLAPTCNLQGDTFFLQHPDGQELTARVVSSVAPERFVLEYLDGKATFELQATEQGGTELTLTHEDFPEDDWADNHAGWVAALLNLKAAADHRVDLRNHDAGRTWREGYCDV